MLVTRQVMTRPRTRAESLREAAAAVARAANTMRKRKTTILLALKTVDMPEDLRTAIAGMVADFHEEVIEIGDG